MGVLKPEYRTALGWQIALALYMQLISWVPLGRWNYQPCCAPGLDQLRRGTLSASDGLMMVAFLLPVAVFWLGARRDWRWVMVLSLLPIGVWLGRVMSVWFATFFRFPVLVFRVEPTFIAAVESSHAARGSLRVTAVATKRTRVSFTSRRIARVTGTGFSLTTT